MSIDGLAWLRAKRLLAALFGAIGAPFAYYSGIVLGAASGAAVAFYVLVGLFYAVATPLLVELGGCFEGRRGRPRREEITGGDLTLLLGLGGGLLGGRSRNKAAAAYKKGLAAKHRPVGSKRADKGYGEQHGLTDDAQVAGASS